MDISGMTKVERVRFFATAKKATAGTIHQIDDGKMRRYWVGKLRGRIVSDPSGTGNYRFHSKDEAMDCARRFREHARKELESIMTEAT